MKKIIDLEISVRLYNGLRKLGFTSLEEVAQCSKEFLVTKARSEARGMGRLCFAELEEQFILNQLWYDGNHCVILSQSEFDKLDLIR